VLQLKKKVNLAIKRLLVEKKVLEPFSCKSLACPKTHIRLSLYTVLSRHLSFLNGKTCIQKVGLFFIEWVKSPFLRLTAWTCNSNLHVVRNGDVTHYIRNCAWRSQIHYHYYFVCIVCIGDLKPEYFPFLNSASLHVIELPFGTPLTYSIQVKKTSGGLRRPVSKATVHGCVWSKFEVIDKYKRLKRIIKVDEWHKSTG
jgi:hypothetical protein